MPQETASSLAAAERRIMRLGEVEQKTGIKRTLLYALIRDNKFPKAVRLGARAVGWASTEVDQWIAQRLSERE